MKRRGLTRRNTDKFELYEDSVMCPDADVRIMSHIYEREYGRVPLSLKEDFCGTGFISTVWVESHPERTAIGIDLDREVLAWGTKKHLDPMSPDERRRIKLMRANVMDSTRPRVDAVCAFNFSYWTFKKRAVLKQYFSVARRSLNKKGIFFLDLMGGTDSMGLEETTRAMGGYKYVWDQDKYNPITNELLCYIHYKFPDKTQHRKAFTYDWRLWTIAELRDVLSEVGFRRVDVYWEGTNKKTREGNGRFRKVRTAYNDPSWVSYIVAIP